MIDSLNKRLNFPRIHKIKLHHFSLFSLAPTITINFEEGVSCLVGANGLGKSTFLNSINYGLTGIVPKPGRGFDSAEEFNHENQAFVEQYFTGRIEYKDHDLAELTIEFDLKDKKYSVTRGLFEVNQLRHLSITSSNGKTRETYENMSPRQLNDEYMQSMTRDIGVASFDQFVFLQTCVFTFDERRDLLFWNNKVLEQTLYLAFGMDPAQAKQADNLRRESEKLDSTVRNSQWQATEVRKKINDLQHEAVTISEDISDEFEQLNKLQSEQEEKVVFLRDSQENIRQQLYRASSELALLRNQYEQVFQSHLHMAHSSLQHPYCRNSGWSISTSIA